METLTTQAGLNELVKQKIEEKINRGTQNAMTAFSRLQHEGRISRDFIAPIGVNIRLQDKSPVMTFEGNGSMRMLLDEQFAKGIEAPNFTLHSNAVSQISEKLGVPLRYVNDLNREDWAANFSPRFLILIPTTPTGKKF